jgi:hypothetical protein
MSVDTVKKSERAGNKKWNTNPYECYSYNSGRSETETTPWLLSFWAGEYYHYIINLQ